MRKLLVVVLVALIASVSAHAVERVTVNGFLCDACDRQLFELQQEQAERERAEWGNERGEGDGGAYMAAEKASPPPPLPTNLDKYVVKVADNATQMVVLLLVGSATTMMFGPVAGLFLPLLLGLLWP